MQEPSHFGNVMAPALFIAILNIIKKQSYFISKKMSYLLLLSVILTFSLVAYFSIIVAFILILLNYRKAGLICVCAMIVSVFMFSAYRYSPDIKMRVDQTISVIANKSQLGKANLSTYSFVSNGLVALKSFQHNLLFGSGIGSHPLSYDKYIAQVASPGFNRVYINREDAGSLFFRIVSETGLLGVSLTFYFIFRFYVSKKKDQYYWVISNAILCLLILNLLRQGNYFYLGFMFFVWAYYFTGKGEANLIDGKSP
jgi:hypothetical protein